MPKICIILHELCLYNPDAASLQSGPLVEESSFPVCAMTSQFGTTSTTETPATNTPTVTSGGNSFEQTSVSGGQPQGSARRLRRDARRSRSRSSGVRHSGTPRPFGTSTIQATGGGLLSSPFFGTTTAASNGSATKFNSLVGEGGTSFGQTNGSGGATSQATKPMFGTPVFGSTQASGLFGTSTTQTTGSGLFSSPTSTMFGATTAAPNGSTIKFEPLIGEDTMMKNNVTQKIQTKHQCITAMKQYETKCLEEIRAEDYLANRKEPQTGSIGFHFGQPQGQQTTGGLFWGTAASTRTSLFGQQKSVFVSTTTASAGGLFGQPSTASSGLFGGQKPLFGATTTTTTASTGRMATGGLFRQPLLSSTALFRSPESLKKKKLELEVSTLELAEHKLHLEIYEIEKRLELPHKYRREVEAADSAGETGSSDK